jgi:hypothetical protein
MTAKPTRTPTARKTARRPGRGVAKRPRRRGADHETAIEKRIAAGEDPEGFLCIDCYCWSLDPVFCGCWARAVFPE